MVYGLLICKTVIISWYTNDLSYAPRSVSTHHSKLRPRINRRNCRFIRKPTVEIARNNDRTHVDILVGYGSYAHGACAVGFQIIQDGRQTVWAQLTTTPLYRMHASTA